jgi:1-acyl-sn-glycerol-3-phosphate acyltransferase
MTLLRRAVLVVYGVYAWSTFLVLGGFALILLLMLPGLKIRRLAGSYAARAWLAIAGIRIVYFGNELLPAGPSVIVANHSSYLDGVLLKAVLPARFAFVIKKEIVSVPLAGLLLKRLGAEFVDRFNRHSGAMDARRLMRTASGGGSLVFFPEGTFTGRPGISRFHGGAFTIAARAGLPVVPLAIRGARNVLPANSIWPRPGRVLVEILPPVYAPETSSPTDVALFQRDCSRAKILAALGEPDLANDDGVAALAAERKSPQSLDM